MKSASTHLAFAREIGPGHHSQSDADLAFERLVKSGCVFKCLMTTD